MKNKYIAVLIVLLWIALTVSAAPTPEEVSMERAKILLFDKQWRPALKEIDRVLAEHPAYPPALYYRARCLAELGRGKDALRGYKDFLKTRGAETLREEARISIIDLAFELYSGGEKGYLDAILDFLKSPTDQVRFYAALKLSYLKDQRVSAQAVPVLKRIAERESDPDLADRARIALLRINPENLRGTGVKRSMEGAMLSIQVVNRRTRKSSLSIRIPFMLARLALEALPDAESKILREHGYSMERIINILSSNGEIIRLETDEDEVRIWVDRE